MKEQKVIKSENPETFLSFKDVNVQELSMEQLINSNHERLSNGEAPFGIFHDDFIRNIQNICDQHNLHTEIYDLFAADKGPSSLPGVTISRPLVERWGENAVKATTLRRVFCNLRLLDFDTNEFTTNLAIAYHQNGIQVGIGNNVKVCHNQCIMYDENYVSTYGKRNGGKNYSANEILDIVAGWIGNIHEKVENDRNIIKNMRQIYVTHEELLGIIGRLQERRVRYDSKIDEIKDRENIYPLNGTQINQFTENILFKANQTRDMLTLWDVYNCATEVYKARTMDIPNILPQNVEMVNFLDQYYGIRNIDKYSENNTIDVEPILITA